MHPAQLAPDQLLAACLVRRQRRSGPGGQHRNKVETGIFLEHRSTSIRAEATEQRSQARNLELAIHRLRVKLAVSVRTSFSNPEASELWLARLQGKRVHVSVAHDDFPSLLAEAMDAVAHFHWDTKAAAHCLGCTPTQLIKLIKAEPKALAEVNRQRTSLGLQSLR